MVHPADSLSGFLGILGTGVVLHNVWLVSCPGLASTEWRHTRLKEALVFGIWALVGAVIPVALTDMVFRRWTMWPGAEWCLILALVIGVHALRACWQTVHKDEKELALIIQSFMIACLSSESFQGRWNWTLMTLANGIGLVVTLLLLVGLRRGLAEKEARPGLGPVGLQGPSIDLLLLAFLSMIFIGFSSAL